ncbi:MAG: hypothetical protein KAG56_00535 [Sulfurovaceae bacterium]|nr:hypothetical protein [Sulfurovaceae bacterium]
MFNQGGLSMEQAPPVKVVLRFFLTASMFGVFLGFYLMGNSLDILPYNEYSFQVTVIHLLALGVMASFMLGALFQMLPVIAGVSITTPTFKATVVNILLIIGLFFQLFAFETSFSLLYLLASIALGVGLLYSMTVMLKEVIKIKDHSTSSKGMLFALSSFSIAIILGLYLLLTLGGYIDGSLYAELKEIHYSFALFGWIGLLIVSISFQVVEMFYVTPKYPTFMSEYLVSIIFSLLILKVMVLFLELPSSIINILLATLFILYASVTIQRLYKRRRPTSDATVWFWRLGMGLLIISMSITLISNITDLDSQILAISTLTFIGFSLSIVFAMVYKIVPFLVWFHLSNQGYMEAPMMFDVIHPKRAKIHFGIHIGMLLSWLVAIFFQLDELFLVVPSLLVMLSFGWLFYHLFMAVRKYDYTQKYTEKIEW